MLRLSKPSLSLAGALGIVFLATTAFAGQGPLPATQANTVGSRSTTAERITGGSYMQLAMHKSEQTARLPVGTIRLRVIPKVGGQTVRAPIRWQVMTFGKDASGDRHMVADVTEPTPEFVLPAGWYVVRAKLPDNKTIRHPVEVTAGHTFKYTLVRN